MDNWISVEDGMPEMHEETGILRKFVKMRSDEVIVTIRDKNNGSLVTHSQCYLWDGKWHGDIFDWLDAGKCNYEVTAWQPLPVPYTGRMAKRNDNHRTDKNIERE